MDTKDTDGHFHHAILNRINRIIKETGYNPIYFRRLVSEIGGYQAVVQLIEKKNTASGLTSLWSCARLDLSIEALILEPEWIGLFSSEQCDTARQRLTEMGYNP